MKPLILRATANKWLTDFEAAIIDVRKLYELEPLEGRKKALMRQLKELAKLLAAQRKKARAAKRRMFLDRRGVLTSVLQFMRAKELLRLQLVCKRWYNEKVPESMAPVRDKLYALNRKLANMLKE